MIVLLIRHGQTEWNSKDIYRGQLNIPLNNTGIKQAKAVGERLKDVDPAAIYTSPLARTKKTAEIIASLQGIQPVTENGFIDIAFGEWEGMSRVEVKNKYPGLFSTWEVTPHKVDIPGAESFDTITKRLNKSLNYLYQSHKDDTVIIVSHGLTNKILICNILGLDNRAFWKIKQDNGAINIFKYTPEGVKLVLLNDTSHICSINQSIQNFKISSNPIGTKMVEDL